MNTIGFVPAKGVRKPRQERNDLILRFDSGLGISRAEGCHNTVILGSTGSGKTTSAILPATAALLKAGFGGLIIDVKGNFTNHVRLLARHCGRAEDIVEFGSGSQATPINMLAHMDMTEAHDFFRTMATRDFAGQTSNMDWHLKGVRIAADCLEALRYAQDKFPAIPANIDAVENLLNDYALAGRLFKVLKDSVLDPAHKQHARFISMVEQEQFHILSFEPKKAGGASSSYAEQTTWRLGAIRNGLDAFRKAPGIMRNFSAPEGHGIDLKRLVYDEKRIVVLRFDVSSGTVGSSLSRHLLERFYQATYENGLGLPDGEHTFLIADEVQEVTDLSPHNRMNDNAFAAKAREFKVIQVIGTQSVSALASRGATMAAVGEYLNNFNNRITLYCDDLNTQDMSMRNLPDVSLTRLGPGQCAVSRFDLGSRRHLAGVDSLQQSHDAIQEVFNQSEFQEGEAMQQTIIQPEAHNEGPDLSEVLSNIEAEQASINPKKEERVRGEIRPRRRIGNGEGDGWRRPAPDFPETESDSRPTQLGDLNPGLREVIERHPQFFRTIQSKGADNSLHVPAGWLPSLDRALAAMEQVQIDVDIQGFSICAGSLTLSDLSRSGMRIGEKLLNKLLVVTCEVCAICGKKVAPPKNDEADRQSFCKKCLTEHGLMPSRWAAGNNKKPGEADPFSLVGL